MVKSIKLCSNIVFIFLLINSYQIVSHGQIVENDYEYDDDGDENSSGNVSFTANLNDNRKLSSIPSTIKGFPDKKSMPYQIKQTSSSTSPKTVSMKQSKEKHSNEEITPYLLAKYLVDQFNHFRHLDIMSRIKHCDSKMILNEMCEMYSFDNHTYALLREPFVEFQSFHHVYDALVDHLEVQKLTKFCSPGHWCLANLTQDDIRFTFDIIQHRGRSFCSMDKCYHRLAAYINTCPSIVAKNISIPAVKLLPMLCNLYEDPTSWSSGACIHQVIHLLHLLYAFWPQIETCHRLISNGADSCKPECLLFEDILNRVEKSCHSNATFLTRVPVLACYRSINLKQSCRNEKVLTSLPIIASMKNFVSPNQVWYRMRERPVYAVLTVLIFLFITVTISLCIYIMIKHRSGSSSRRFDDDYEYTRLNDPSFELTHNNSSINSHGLANDSNNHIVFDRNGNQRSPEHQRLLYVEP